MNGISTNNNKFSTSLLLMLAAVFSAITAASLPSLAFATEGNVEISDNDEVNQQNVQLAEQSAIIDSDNKIKGDNSSVSNLIAQSSEQNALNTFKDNDTIKLPKDYEGNVSVSDDDTVNQNNVQLSEQDATIDSDNKLKGDGSSVDNAIIQSSEQNSLNAFFDNDKLHVQTGYEGNIEVCDDDDVTQTNIQSSEQNATIGSDNKLKGDGSSVDNAIIQSSPQNAANIFKDNDKIKVKKPYEGDIMVCDNDTVEQSNILTSEQNATIDSDNEIKGNGSSVGNFVGQDSEQNGANVLEDNDTYKFK